MVVRIIAVLAVLAALATAAWFLLNREPPPPPPASAPAAPPVPPTAEGPRHPIEASADRPLPPLKQSDPAILEALASLFGSAQLQRFFNLESLVVNFVATIDNLPRESYATRLNPMKPIGGALATTGSEASLAIAPGNSRRYAAFVGMVEKVDAADAAAAYRRLYPLFQQAYVELGYPNGYFNDRLVDVIDHLLATPQIEGSIALAQPHVLYEFADPQLEERSSGQKAMLRMGRENAARLKAKLRELRAQVGGAGTPR